MGYPATISKTVRSQRNLRLLSNLKGYRNQETRCLISNMCYSILVAKRICQYGHLNQWTACWAQCEPQMAANLQEMDFNRLCDDVDAERFTVIKSHAKKHTATSYPSDCEVCLMLEHTESGWASSRDRLVAKLSELDTKEAREEVLRIELEKAKRNPDSSSAVEGLEDEHWIQFLDLLATQDELRRDKLNFEKEKALKVNQETVEVASQLLRSCPWSTFYGTDTRKFFLSHFQKDEENFNDFEEGKFDESFIIEYLPDAPPTCSFRTVKGVDFSPPDGRIGLIDTNAILDAWVKQQEDKMTETDP